MQNTGLALSCHGWRTKATSHQWQHRQRMTSRYRRHKNAPQHTLLRPLQHRSYSCCYHITVGFIYF
jgi:hypothetical protein